jgi:hypothetical protein
MPVWDADFVTIQGDASTERPFSMIDDKDFLEYRRILADEDQIFKPFSDVKGIEAFKGPIDSDNFYSIKAIAKLEKLSRTSMVQLLTDVELRKSWDAFMKDFVIIERFSEHQDMIYISSKLPRGITDRDYVQYRCIREEEGMTTILFKHAEHAGALDRSGHQRGAIKIMGYQIKDLPLQSSNGGGCELSLISVNNPKGSIPMKLINWLGLPAKGPPKWIASLMEGAAKHNLLLE